MNFLYKEFLYKLLFYDAVLCRIYKGKVILITHSEKSTSSVVTSVNYCRSILCIMDVHYTP